MAIFLGFRREVLKQTNPRFQRLCWELCGYGKGL